MKFEDQFPSLKGGVQYRIPVDYESDLIEDTEEAQKRCIYYDKLQAYATVDIDDIKRCCLDKQRVKEALIEFEARKEPNKNFEVYSEEVRLQIFRKRLGLDD